MDNQKILVSNGKSLVIKTLTSFYLYPLDKTPLNYILDKDFLINKIPNLEERVINDKFVNYKFLENEKNNNAIEPWSKLDKTAKTKKLILFATFHLSITLKSFTFNKANSLA